MRIFNKTNLFFGTTLAFTIFFVVSLQALDGTYGGGPIATNGPHKVASLELKVTGLGNKGVNELMLDLINLLGRQDLGQMSVSERNPVAARNLSGSYIPGKAIGLYDHLEFSKYIFTIRKGSGYLYLNISSLPINLKGGTSQLVFSDGTTATVRSSYGGATGFETWTITVSF